MRFAPQRRALFHHLNFQKCFENGVLCTFWLRNALCATTACNFSSLIWHALASLLFDLPQPQIIGKTYCFATLLPFRALAASFLWLFLFFDLFSSSLLCHIVGSLASKLPWIILLRRMRYRSNTFDFPPVQLASFCFATFHERIINP